MLALQNWRNFNIKTIENILFCLGKFSIDIPSSLEIVENIGIEVILDLLKNFDN